MKKVSHLVLSLIPILFISCSSGTIKISQDFDHGSIGELKEIQPDYFKGTTRHWLKRDGIGDQYYWFYFRADQVKGKTITFELNDLVGVYRGNEHIVYTDYTQPVYSYDQNNWYRIADVNYDSLNHTFIFSERFDHEAAWIAYAHPYSYSRYRQLVSGLEDEQYVSIEPIATTAGGREIRMVSITDQDIQADQKKVVLIMAIQHAGEDAGGYFVEGMIDYILSDTPDAAVIRENYIYKFLPMMNPDGMYKGVSRYNSRMEDLNNIWMNDDRAQEEVSGVKHWTDQWLGSGESLDLFIDVHNHSQHHKYNAFISLDEELDSLVLCMNHSWPIRSLHAEFEGSSCAWFQSRDISSGTIELSQSRINEGPYLTIEDYYQYGEGTVKAISEYFSL